MWFEKERKKKSLYVSAQEKEEEEKKKKVVPRELSNSANFIPFFAAKKGVWGTREKREKRIFGCTDISDHKHDKIFR